MVLVWVKPISYYPIVHRLMAISTPGTTYDGRRLMSKMGQRKRIPRPKVSTEKVEKTPTVV